MKEITVDNINLVNYLCLKDGERHAVLSQERLLSALSNQYQPYDSDEKVIASLYRALIIDHAFENGNKRTAVIVMMYLALLIKKMPSLTDQQLYDLTYKIADVGGSTIKTDDLAYYLFSNYQKISINKTLKEFTISFCKEHKWLMDKLAE